MLLQVPRRAASLNSHSVFVLRTKRGSWFLWCGRSSTGDEREMAKRVALSAGGGGDLLVVYEGQEKDDFWAALGGVEDYDVDPPAEDARDPRPARLFCCLAAASSAFAGNHPRLDSVLSPEGAPRNDVRRTSLRETFCVSYFIRSWYLTLLYLPYLHDYGRLKERVLTQ